MRHIVEYFGRKQQKKSGCLKLNCYLSRKNSGRQDLAIGVYVLEEDRQTYEHDRHIPDPVRVAVLQRDGFKCVRCGWNRSMLSPDDPRKMLELHHVRHHKDKGKNTAENLITLCNVHHDEEHRHGK
jgi:5-methylcytosine-specific restriction endonuclease McrA